MAHQRDLPCGCQLHERYTVKETLGRGTFGITYLAIDRTLKRQVAIKELLPEGFVTRANGCEVAALDSSFDADWEWARDRFLAEAVLLAKFHHPNIVAVLDFFAANGTAYLVMPYLEGTHLNGLLEERGAFQLEDLRAFLFPVLDGLRKVHVKGILHRDIKPDNIWITHEGVPILLDFGAARQAIGVRTQEVTVIETASYAPIEQSEGKGRLGEFSDIYAMAVVFHKCLTLELPPKAVSRVRHDTYRPLASYVTHLPKPLLAAVDWGLALDEKDRPQNVDQWLEALEASGTGADPRRKTRLGAALGVLVASGLAAGLYISQHSSPVVSPPLPPAPIPAPAPTPAPETPPPRLLAGTQAGQEKAIQVIPHVALRFCWCPPGNFMMGSSDKEIGMLPKPTPAEEQRAHPVTIEHGFWMAKYETMEAEVEKIRSALQGQPIQDDSPADPQQSLPQGEISWQECKELVQKMNERHALPGWRVDLPTEEQWEYACRAGTTTAYSFGASLNGNMANYDGNYPFPPVEDGQAHGDHLATRTHAGYFGLNGWNLADLHGNLEEWCLTSRPSRRLDRKEAIVRGGSYESYARNCRSASRRFLPVDTTEKSVGFRLVMTLDSGKTP